MSHDPGVAPPPSYPGPETDYKYPYQPPPQSGAPPPVGFNVGVDPGYPPPANQVCMYVYLIPGEHEPPKASATHVLLVIHYIHCMCCL